MDLGKKIKELRTEAKLNQRELAKHIGVSQPSIMAWENGENEPKASYIKKLSEFFKVSSDYLLGLEE